MKKDPPPPFWKYKHVKQHSQHAFKCKALYSNLHVGPMLQYALFYGVQSDHGILVIY